MVDASAIGVSTVLVRADTKDQLHVISNDSRFFTENEQKFAF